MGSRERTSGKRKVRSGAGEGGRRRKARGGTGARVGTKSPLALAKAALRIGEKALGKYSHRFSPQRYTQAQLFALLAMKEFLRQDYRGVVALVEEWPQVQQALGLSNVPHYSTLCYAARRLFAHKSVARLLGKLLAEAGGKGLLRGPAQRVAVDSTGLESRHQSRYFVLRAGKRLRYTRFPKLTVVCDAASHLILGAVVDRGPRVDQVEFEAAVGQAHRRWPFKELVADAAYDAEANHVWVQEKLGARTVIPAKIGRPAHDPAHLPPTLYRRKMAQHFDRASYGQRWQVESVFSRLKRCIGSSLRARRRWSQHREILARLIVHNLMLFRFLLQIQAFQQSMSDTTVMPLWR
jgi:transposase